jgi:hypothetical protein
VTILFVEMKQKKRVEEKKTGRRLINNKKGQTLNQQLKRVA